MSANGSSHQPRGSSASIRVVKYLAQGRAPNHDGAPGSKRATWQAASILPDGFSPSLSFFLSQRGSRESSNRTRISIDPLRLTALTHLEKEEELIDATFITHNLET